MDNISANSAQPSLKRVIGLPLLVFYGLGVTVGAGIYALIGEIIGIAGSNAPLSFVVSGLIAATSAVSYALLTAVYPRAAGEAYFVRKGLGALAGQIVGWGLVATAVTSSAAIALAFSSYLNVFLPFSVAEPLAVIGCVAIIGAFACFGVRESLLFAAAITLVEIGILVLILIVGAKHISVDSVSSAFVVQPQWSAWAGMFSGALVAFFAYLGFEDIVNMGEETIDAQSVGPKAIFITLGITVLLYLAVCLVAVSIPNASEVARADAPISKIYESLTGRSGQFISGIASIAMLNGILVQVVMASRVVYGTLRDSRSNAWFAHIHPGRRTPERAIWLVCGLVTLGALFLPIVPLARLTSLILLSVFSLVNFALWNIGRDPNSPAPLRRWRFWGLIALVFSSGLLILEVYSLFAVHPT